MTDKVGKDASGDGMLSEQSVPNVFIDTYQSRLAELCAETSEKLKNQEDSHKIDNASVHIDSLLQQVVDISLNGLTIKERDGILSKYLDEQLKK